MFSLAIVGRPNVGKSTLFNRLARKQLAMVSDTPGLTRDWREAEADINGHKIRLLDTAGLEESFDDSIRGRMRRQTEAALAEADAVLFLIDGRAGLTPLDTHFAGWLRKQKLPVLLGVNKCENEKATMAGMAEAYSLGFGDPIALSAEHDIGTPDLFEMLIPLIEESEEETVWDDEADENASDVADLDALEGQEDFAFPALPPEEETKPIKLAIAGRPNVGKSTLLNALVGQERVMTGPEAGITRDAVAVRWTYKDRKFRLVDTAGLRKKAKIHEEIEKMAVTDSLRAIRLAQVVVLVIDADQLLEKQDLSIAEHILNEGRALVIAINKWDEVKYPQDTLEEFKYRVSKSLAQVQNIPFVTISALTGKNVTRLMDAVLDIYQKWQARVPTGRLNRWLAMMESRHPAPMVQGRPNRIKYITQIKTRPPTFALWVSVPKRLPASYKRYLINGIRDEYNLPGVPVRLLVRTSKNPYN